MNATSTFPSLHAFVPAESGSGCAICGRKKEAHR